MQISACFPSLLRNSIWEATHSYSNLSRCPRCGFGGSLGSMNMHEPCLPVCVLDPDLKCWPGQTRRCSRQANTASSGLSTSIRPRSLGHQASGSCVPLFFPYAFTELGAANRETVAWHDSLVRMDNLSTTYSQTLQKVRLQGTIIKQSDTSKADTPMWAKIMFISNYNCTVLQTVTTVQPTLSAKG